MPLCSLCLCGYRLRGSVADAAGGVSWARTCRIVHAITEQSRLLGYIAIDSTVAGRARGGLRLAADLSEDEICAAATSMTLKYGLARPPARRRKGRESSATPTPHRSRGGGCSARLPCGGVQLLRDRRYVPDADLGTTAAGGARDDAGHRRARAARASGAPIIPASTRRDPVLATARALLERRGATLAGCRVAIEGFGKVGAALARLLARTRRDRRGDLDLSRRDPPSRRPRCRAGSLGRAGQVGSRVVEEEPGTIDRARLLELPVDLLLSLRALSQHPRRQRRADRRRRRSAAGANDPVSPEAERMLAHARCRVRAGLRQQLRRRARRHARVRRRRVATHRRRSSRSRCVAWCSISSSGAERPGVSPAPAGRGSEALARHADGAGARRASGLAAAARAAGLAAYHRGWMPAALARRARGDTPAR